MATIGKEGCTAAQAVLGAESSSIRLLVQFPRGRGKDVARGLHTGHGVDAILSKSHVRLRRLMYAYVRAFLEQVLVSVVCNGAHSLEQRQARWLLTMRDHSDDDALQITQNLLAECWYP
jgi:hypothetical protein